MRLIGQLQGQECMRRLIVVLLGDSWVTPGGALSIPISVRTTRVVVLIAQAASTARANMVGSEM